MAYFLNRGLAEAQYKFIVEKVSDIEKLPTHTEEGDIEASFGKNAYRRVGYGSRAWCIENGCFYVLQTNDEWVQTTFGASGSGGGGSGGSSSGNEQQSSVPYCIIDDGQIDEDVVFGNIYPSISVDEAVEGKSTVDHTISPAVLNKSITKVSDPYYSIIGKAEVGFAKARMSGHLICFADEGSVDDAIILGGIGSGGGSSYTSMTINDIKNGTSNEGMVVSPATINAILGDIEGALQALRSGGSSNSGSNSGIVPDDSGARGVIL